MNWNIKTNKVFQKEWAEFKDHYSTEGYCLKYVFEIYLPFWQCKQNIIVEKDLEMDRFSKILLELIINGYSSHSEICQFLGIEEDNFCTMQLHFLIKNNLIREKPEGYEVTHEGLDFLKNRKKPKTLETEEFDYMVKEKYNFLKNDITNDFFDPSKPIDEQLSTLKKMVFSGYEILQTHKIKKQGEVTIGHINNPTYRKIAGKRNDFTEFFTAMNPAKNFYDFADSEFESHKRSICFLGFWYEKEDDSNDRKIDIRQFEKTVKKFENNELEEELSDKVTKYILNNDVKIGDSSEEALAEISDTAAVENEQQNSTEKTSTYNIKDLLYKASEKCKKDADGWILMNEFGIALKKLEFKNEYPKLKPFLQSIPNLVEIREDCSHKLPLPYVKLKASGKNEFKFCSECGTKLKITAKFCTQCGTKQEMEVENE
ncbi:MAG: zinc-ribbon domain-containing protein [Fibromonadaceae bacterium]|jgi:hypothetical protein|nr:zinc-ribbon domain-containing protein [Fibromonadaceae bacterium]